jgi:hypothetical protein
VELPFRIKFSLSRKLSSYELPAISKWHKVVRHCKSAETKKYFFKNECKRSI